MHHPACHFAAAGLSFWLMNWSGKPKPTVQPDALPGFPVALAVRIPVALVRDLQDGQLWLIHEPGYAEVAAEVVADVEAVLSDRTSFAGADRGRWLPAIREPEARRISRCSGELSGS